MTDSAVIFFGMKLQTYEMFKSLKNNEPFKSIDENEFLMFIFNKVGEDLNGIDPKKNVAPTPLTSPNSYQTTEIPLYKVVKTEKLYTTETTKTSAEKESDIHKNEVEGCQLSSQSDVETRDHSSSARETDSDQYRCSCGTVFPDLKSFLKHNAKCPTVKQEQSTNGLKRSFSAMKKEEESINEQFSNFRKNNCEDCQRTFRTSSSFYRHQCVKKLKLHSTSDTSPKTIPNEELSLNSALSQDGRPLPLKQGPVLICHCSKEFYDHIQFFNHTKTCGNSRSDVESSRSGNNNKTSPLKVLPNRDGKYECTDCPKTFTSILSLRQHHDGLHRTTPKFVCENCGKVYRWCSSLKYHKDQCTNKH